MTERERWIVYPLVLFALGAALRDKFMQHVSTKEVQCQQLVAKQIYCEDLSVRDPTKDDRIVAKLTSSAPDLVQAGQGPDRFGVLLLFDSEGKELCGVTNQALSVREINCFALKVVDPDNASRALAALTSAAVPSAEPGGLPRRFGVLALNNQEFGQLVGNPPPNPATPPPAADDDESRDRDNESAETEAPPAKQPDATDQDEQPSQADQ